MRKVITLLTVVLCVLILKSEVIATVYFYDTGLSYTIGAVPGNDTYLGSIVNDDLWLDYNTANTPGTHLNLADGGSVGGDLEAFGNSSVNISGGSVGNHTHSHDNSSVTISGGSAGINIYASDNSTITMNGGSVGYGLRAYGNGMIYLDGSNFAVTAGGVTTALTIGQSLSIYGTLIEGDTVYYTGTITGTLVKGGTLDNTFRIYIYNPPNEAYAGTADIVIIPEPCTLSLLALGGVALLRKRRRAYLLMV